MSDSKLCTLCLAKDVRMFDITGSQYQVLINKNVDRKINSKVYTTMPVCYICYHELKKFSEFLLGVQHSYDLLCQTATTKTDYVIKKPIWNFIITPTTTYSIPDEREARVKVENLIKDEILNNLDIVDRNNDDLEQDDNIKDGISESDSEDNIPLKHMQKQESNLKSEGRKRKKFVKLKTKKRERGFKGDYAIEIILSKEEQLKAMAERTTSMNYVNAAMKCERCYKGFVDTAAYENHMKRHDESSGAHACPICGLRYGGRRQLAAHAATAHQRRYRCVTCGHLSATAHQARSHEKWHRGYLYDCKLCGLQFSKPTSYLTHLRTRHHSSQWCVDCGAGFVSERGLVMHRAKAHLGEESKQSEEPASERYCEECNVQFSSRLAWTRHVLTSVKHAVDSQDSTVCKICKTTFQCTTSLALHRKEHMKALQPTKLSLSLDQAPIKLKCEQCGALFLNESKLQRHVKRTHLGIKYDKKLVCEICSKKCTSNATLKYHQRIHTGEKPFECSTCAKRFVDTNQLKIHTRTHTGEKPYICNVCGKRFTQKPALNRHHRVHTGAKPYNCQYCTKTFSQSSSMKIHTRVVHLKKPPNLKNSMVQNGSEQRVENSKESLQYV